VATLTQSELESHLWKAADILRGHVDAGKFKDYIFALLFYRRLCDVWGEEFEDLLAETGDRARGGDTADMAAADDSTAMDEDSMGGDSAATPDAMDGMDMGADSTPTP